MNDPTYELKFTHDGPFDIPLIIEADGERVAELDVCIGPDYDGADNIEMNPGVCTKVFDGHHWRRPTRLRHERPMRRCVLCEKEQRKVDRWEDVNDD